MNLIDRAREFATRAHAGQTRKYTGDPYINHCAEVAALVEEFGHSEEMTAAAWLHDTIEDCPDVTRSDIMYEFGTKVERLVMEVTDVSKPTDGNRKIRKAIDRAHLSAASQDGCTIKLADIISNTKNIVERDPSFAVIYLAEKDELLNVLERGNCILWLRARGMIDEAKAMLPPPPTIRLVKE